MSYADIGAARVRAMNLAALDSAQRHRYGDPPWTDYRVGNRGSPSTIGALGDSLTSAFDSAKTKLTTPVVASQKFSTPLVIALVTGVGYFLIKKV